jgi:hypothetical protein
MSVKYRRNYTTCTGPCQAEVPIQRGLGVDAGSSLRYVLVAFIIHCQSNTMPASG